MNEISIFVLISLVSSLVFMFIGLIYMLHRIYPICSICLRGGGSNCGFTVIAQSVHKFYAFSNFQSEQRHQFE